MENSFDLTVIGAGPGGYVAAIRAAQLGMKVAVVESRAKLGGTCLKGKGVIKSASEVIVKNEGGKEESVSTRKILIATGSDVMPLPGVAVDEKRIVSSTGALVFEAVPKHLVVIGGGVIGLELGS